MTKYIGLAKASGVIALTFITILTYRSANADTLPDGEVYQSLDKSTVITVVSSDELEAKLKGRKDILLGEYTVQDDRVRVVLTIEGTKKVYYFRVIPEGLRSEQTDARTYLKNVFS